MDICKSGKKLFHVVQLNRIKRILLCCDVTQSFTMFLRKMINLNSILDRKIYHFNIMLCKNELLINNKWKLDLFFKANLI